MNTGKRSGAKSSGRSGCEPREHLPLRDDHPGRQPRNLLRVGARGQHEALGFHLAALCADADAVLAGRPLEHALVDAYLRTLGARALDVRDDAALRKDEAAVALVHEPQLGRKPERREAASDLGAVQLLVLQAVLDARPHGALEDPRAALDGARDEEQLLAGLGLELAPELVRAQDERHVARVLEVRLTDDPREPVRGAELVRDREALDPEHALPSSREVVERRAPHPTDPDDDRVVPLGHGPILRCACG